MKQGFIDQCSSSETSFIPLSPISFLERASIVHGDKTSILYGSSLRFSWKETHRRCLNLAASLVRLGLSRHDVVAAFAPNVPAMYELHFAAPMAGGILSALNFCLDDTTLAVVFRKLEPKLIFVDHQFVNVVLKALDSLTGKIETPTLVLIQEPDDKAETLDILSYESLASYDHEEGFAIVRPRDERDPISVSYTSGSTGTPKGAVYSHRAVYLNSLAVIVSAEMRRSSVFLWTVDMFRCNGWCYPWATAALGATNVCLRTVHVSPEFLLAAVSFHGVTHFCCKPALLTTLAEATTKPLPFKVSVVVAGAMPSRETLARVTEIGLDVSRGYGMTEALGPAIVEPWRLGDDMADDYRYSSRLVTVEGFDVKDPGTMESVPGDGETAGEIMLRGNTLMSGYIGNPSGAFRDGWYRTGDVGVRHADGSVQVKDRVDDAVAVRGTRRSVIISTLEVEAALMRHPKVSEAAVVGRGKSGGDQVPCAFVKLKEGCESSHREIVEFCKDSLPGYMVPQAVVFGDLPVNSTGKVQKFALRFMANNNNNRCNGYTNGTA